MRRKPKTIPFRRKKEGKTNYKKRIALIKSGKPKISVRITNNNVCVQLIDFNMDGDKVVIEANARELKKIGWDYGTSNMSSAYLTGILMAKKMKDIDRNEGVIEFGFKQSMKGNKLYAVVKGLVDGGINTHQSNDLLPDESRIKGEHIINAFKNKKNDIQFCKTKNIEKMSEKVEEIKSNLLK